MRLADRLQLLIQGSLGKPPEWKGYHILPAELFRVVPPMNTKIQPIQMFVSLDRLVPTDNIKDTKPGDRWYPWNNKKVLDMYSNTLATKTMHAGVAVRYKDWYFLLDAHHRTTMVGKLLLFPHMPITLVALQPESKRWQRIMTLKPTIEDTLWSWVQNKHPDETTNKAK